MRFVGLLFVIIVIGFIIGFVVLNTGNKGDVDVFTQKFTSIPIAMICFFAFLAGMIFVLVFALADEIVLRNSLLRMKKENNNLKKELDALRNLPFEEEK